jgi:cysteine synthase
MDNDRKEDILKKFTNTPLICANRYWPKGNLFVKLDGNNMFGGIKARTAFYMLKELTDKKSLHANKLNVVESSSGNLAMALHKLSKLFDVNFLCLADKSIPKSKRIELINTGVNIQLIEKGNFSDLRSARIAKANELGQQKGWVWANQYANIGNFKGHFETTGPELWNQTSGALSWVVCSVGSAGTICGIGNYLKGKNQKINIVGVEPVGSTSFGGNPGPYISAGSGMREPSELLSRFGDCVDYYSKVTDEAAAIQCNNFFKHEKISVGITTGHNLAAANEIASKTDKIVVVISADNGCHYTEELKKLKMKTPQSYHFNPKIMRIEGEFNNE